MKKLGKSGSFPKLRADVFTVGEPLKKSLAKFLRALESVKSSVSLPKHVKFLEEGQMPEGIFVLVNGSAKLLVSLRSGKTLILRVVRSGEVLGLSATMSSSPAEYSAETLCPTQFLYVPRKDFLRQLEMYPEICVSVVEVLSHQLRDAVNMIHYSSGSQPAAEKLSDLLESWCTESGEVSERGTELKLPLTQEEIGQMIGVSRETVSRLFAEFEEQGILEMEGSRICIPKGRSLAQLQMSKGRKAERAQAPESRSSMPSGVIGCGPEPKNDTDPAT